MEQGFVSRNRRVSCGREGQLPTGRPCGACGGTGVSSREATSPRWDGRDPSRDSGVDLEPLILSMGTVQNPQASGGAASSEENSYMVTGNVNRSPRPLPGPISKASWCGLLRPTRYWRSHDSYEEASVLGDGSQRLGERRRRASCVPGNPRMKEGVGRPEAHRRSPQTLQMLLQKVSVLSTLMKSPSPPSGSFSATSWVGASIL